MDIHILIEQIRANPSALLPFAIIALVIIALAAGFLFERKRSMALAEAARGFGFSFDPGETAVSLFQGNAAIVDHRSAFKLFAKGHNRRTYNISSGVYNNRSWQIFDYSYVTGHGKHRSTHTCSVALASGMSTSLPAFILAPESFFDKIAEKLGFTDVDFPDYPVFSQKYLLKGSDEMTLRGLFTPEILRFFEENQMRSTIEADSDQFIYYTTGRRIKPQDFGAFLEQADCLLRLFSGRGQ